MNIINNELMKKEFNIKGEVRKYEFVRLVNPSGKHPVNDTSEMINISQFDKMCRHTCVAFVLLHTSYRDEYEKLLIDIHTNDEELRRIGINSDGDGTVCCVICSDDYSLIDRVVFAPCNNSKCHTFFDICPIILARYDRSGINNELKKGEVAAHLILQRIWKGIQTEINCQKLRHYTTHVVSA